MKRQYDRNEEFSFPKLAERFFPIKLPVIATGLFGNGHLSAAHRQFLVLSFCHSFTLWLKFGWQHTCKTAIVN